ncbi:uncharacterized protein LOC127864827 [Dreissena polymorpha]|uniref:Sorting nexin-19 n=1 Tax=Dreissena polymorpha TaxID=45954 RepID=A0A9D4NKS4_DREPO|nr:uncharacterized protein LOC127864827 [Dreissena polymorpha]KAH3898458.1 hypothetical protein DPMN_022690 [Dreissena polymorpha]
MAMMSWTIKNAMKAIKLCSSHIKEWLGLHNRFSTFQKVIITSICVGVLLCIFRNLWCLLLLVTYVSALYGSVTVINYLAQQNNCLPSDAVLIVWENIATYVHSTLFIDSSQNRPNNSLSGDASIIEQSDVSKILDKELKSQETDTQLKQVENETTKETDLECHHLQKGLDFEILKLIKLVEQDFVKSWMKLFTNETELYLESEQLLQHIFQGIIGRLHRSHIHYLQLFNVLIYKYKEHVHHIKQAEMIYKSQSKMRRRSSLSLQSMSSQNVYQSVEECFFSKVEKHPAIKLETEELAYLRSVVELLLMHLIREDTKEINALFCALEELLVSNLFQNVINLVSDPTFIHEKVIAIMSDEVLNIGPIEESIQGDFDVKLNSENDVFEECVADTNEDSVENVMFDLETKSENMNVNPTNETAEIIEDLRHDLSKWLSDTEVHEVIPKFCAECNRLCSVHSGKISPRPHSCNIGTTPLFRDPSIKDPDRMSINSLDFLNSVSSNDGVIFKFLESEIDEERNDLKESDEDDVEAPQVLTTDQGANCVFNPSEAKSTSEVALTMPKITSKFQMPNINSIGFGFPNPLNLFPRKRSSSSEKSDLSPGLSPGLSPTCGQAEFFAENSTKNNWRKSSSTGDVLTLLKDGDLPSSVAGQTVFQDIRITSTESAKEAGTAAGTYTLYKLEYDALYGTEDGELVHRTGMVKRRYSEFINLQSRLEDNKDYKRRMKDIKGPKRMLPSLPFGNMGKETVESRKEQLELFIKSLLKCPDICNGEEMKQFLGFSGDGHIAFVRKIPENTGPRIDQRFVKRMSGVFDMIVEGLPSLPQSKLPRIISPFDSSEPKFEDISSLTEDPDDIAVMYNEDLIEEEDDISIDFDKFVTEMVMTISEQECDITLGTSILTWQSQQETGSSRMTLTKQSDDAKQCLQSEQSECPVLSSPVLNTECPITESLLDVLTVLLQGRSHWLCREGVIHMARIVVGKGLNRFLESKINSLITKEMLEFYVHTLNETVWPNGELSDDVRPHYTDEQKERIKSQATRCLSEFLPGALKALLGAEDFQFVVEEMIHSVQYEQINRHLVYTLLDLIVEELFPEVNAPELQRKLSATVDQSR